MPNAKKTSGNGNGNGGRKPGRPQANNRTTQPMARRAAKSGIMTDQLNSRLVQNNQITLKGSDFITTVSVAKSTTPQSRILATFPISPSAYPGTRLTQFSNLYEFFRFNSFRIRYVSAVPDTIACQFVVYIDLDPLDDAADIGDPDSLIRQAVAQTGAMQFNFNGDKNIPLAMRADRQLYFTGQDKQNARFSQQGRAYLIQVTDPIDFNGQSLTGPLEAGSLFIDWSCMFSTPQLNPGALLNTLPQGALDTVKALNYTYTPATDSDVWEPSWAPGGTPLLKPRTFYIASMYLDYPSLRGFCNAPGTSVAILWGDENGNILAGLSKLTISGIPDAPGLLGTLILETDANGIPKNKPFCELTGVSGVKSGLSIRPLYVDSNPFSSAFLNNKTITEEGEITTMTLHEFSKQMASKVRALQAAPASA